jgi:hypothetical protein
MWTVVPGSSECSWQRPGQFPKWVFVCSWMAVLPQSWNERWDFLLRAASKWRRPAIAMQPQRRCAVSWPRGVTVSTLDSESSDRGSNPREASLRFGFAHQRSSLTCRVSFRETLLLFCKALHARAFVGKVVPRGLEPRTLRLLAVRSNQLSYETSWEQFTNDAREELPGVQIFCAGSCGSVWLQSWRSKGE